MALSSFSIKFGSISCPYESHRTGTSPRLLKLNHVLSFRVSADSTPKARFVARRTESVLVPQLQRPLSNVRMMFRILSMQCHCFDFSIFDEFIWFRVIRVFVVVGFSGEYMSLPASQYSVLDAERIERVDENTFRCYVYRFKFFAFEVCPVLLVKVEEQPNGCCIKLLSCKVCVRVCVCVCNCLIFVMARLQVQWKELNWMELNCEYLMSPFASVSCLQLDGSPIAVAQNDKFDGEKMFT